MSAQSGQQQIAINSAAQISQIKLNDALANKANAEAGKANELEEETYKINIAQIEQNYRNSVIEGVVKGIQGQALQAGIRLTNAQVGEIRALLPLKGAQMGQGISESKQRVSESEVREAFTKIQTLIGENKYNWRGWDDAVERYIEAMSIVMGAGQSAVSLGAGGKP